MDDKFWPDNGKKMVSVEEAFVAMRIFIKEYWEMRGSSPGELGDLLANIVPLRDGGPADPASWMDWLESIEKAGGAQPTGR